METTAAVLVRSSILVFLAIIPAHSRSFYTTDDYRPARQKVTKIRGYVHDTLSGDNPTAVEIARPKNAKEEDGPPPFGSLFAFDNPVTDGPDLKTSKIIGNAKGTYLSGSREKKAFKLVMGISVGFTTGEFNGSSVSVLSRNPVTQKTRELAIVGGTGRFRFGRGFVELRTVEYDPHTGDAVLQYDVTVVHY